MYESKQRKHHYNRVQINISNVLPMNQFYKSNSEECVVNKQFIWTMGNFWKVFCEVDAKFPKNKELNNFCKKKSILILKRHYFQKIPEKYFPGFSP